MIRRFLTRLAAKWLNRARDERRISDRERFRAKAQSMREAMGLPHHPSLTTTKGN